MNSDWGARGKKIGAPMGEKSKLERGARSKRERKLHGRLWREGRLFSSRKGIRIFKASFVCEKPQVKKEERAGGYTGEKFEICREEGPSQKANLVEKTQTPRTVGVGIFCESQEGAKPKEVSTGGTLDPCLYETPR